MWALLLCWIGRVVDRVCSGRRLSSCMGLGFQGLEWDPGFLVLDIPSREVKRGNGGELLLFLIGV